MTTLILTGFMLASVLMLGLASAMRGSVEAYSDLSYRNTNGDHIYYERSLIEKKLYLKHYPKSTLRSLSRLFAGKFLRIIKKDDASRRH